MRKPSVFLLLAAVGVGCGGGFRPAQPTGDEIVFARNSTLQVKQMDFAKAQPLPLPRLSPAYRLGEVLRPDRENLLEMPPIGAAGTRHTTMVVAPPEEADISVFPYDSAAKMYFNAPGPHSCSSQFVGDTDVILTAGHCVYADDRNAWHTDFQFLRGYREGSWVQQFDWSCVAIFSGWAHGDYRKDYAFVKVRSSAPRAMGLKYAVPDPVEAIGYPSNYFGGQRLMRVVGNRRAASSGLVAMDSPFGPGSSGGAWLDASSAVSVNSFKYTNDNTTMYGPAFDGRARRLFEFVRNDCSEAVPPTKASAIPESLRPEESSAQVISQPTRLSPFVEVVDSRECACGGRAFEVVNPLEFGYAVTLEVRREKEPGRSDAPAERVVFLAPGERELLGCKAGSAEGRDCTSGVVPLIVRSSRLVVQQDHLGVRSVATIDPAFCAKRCIDSPNDGYCAALGNDAKSILAPLAGFVNNDLHGAPANGVVTTKAELAKRFGATKPVEDPCERTDFLEDGDRVRNDGLSCRTMTPEVGTTAALRMSLTVPSVSSGKPASMLPAFGFDRRVEAPVLEFIGVNGEALTQRYGGVVVATQSIDGKLIVTTENGCVVGPEK